MREPGQGELIVQGPRPKNAVGSAEVARFTVNPGEGVCESGGGPRTFSGFAVNLATSALQRSRPRSQNDYFYLTRLCEKTLDVRMV